MARLAILVVIATTVATLCALAARAGWFLELFSHFRVQYLCFQIAAALSLLLLRRPRWGALALVAAAPNAWVVAPYLPGLAGEPAGLALPGAPAPVSLIAFNLSRHNDDAASTRVYLDRKAPDVLVLSEFTPRWRSALRELENKFPYHALRPQRNAWGLAVFSKYPLRAIEALDLGDPASQNLRVILDLPGGAAELYAVHLVSPTSLAAGGIHHAQLRKLAARIAASDPALPRLVAGDLNLSPYSPWFGDLLRDAGLRDARRPAGLHYTWPTGPLPLWIPIDYCLANPGILMTRVVTGPAVGSDHLPLECTFSLRDRG